MPDRVVIVALDLAHLGTVLRDRVAPTLAHMLMHKDHAAAAKQPRAPGDGAAMVAIGGAGHGGGADDFSERARQQVA